MDFHLTRGSTASPSYNIPISSSGSGDLSPAFGLLGSFDLLLGLNAFAFWIGVAIGALVQNFPCSNNLGISHSWWLVFFHGHFGF